MLGSPRHWKAVLARGKKQRIFIGLGDMKPGLSLSPFLKHWRALAFGAGLVFLGTAVTAASNYPPIGWSQVDGGMTVGGTGIYPYACTLNSDNTTCTLNTTGGSFSGSVTIAGGSISNTAFGISGTLPAFASTPTFNIGTGGVYNATPPTLTNGALSQLQLDGNGNLKVFLENPAAGYTASQAQTAASGNSFLGAACAYYGTPPTLTTGQINPCSVDSSGNMLVNVANGITGSVSVTNQPSPAPTDPAPPVAETPGIIVAAYPQSSSVPWAHNLTQIAGTAVVNGGTAGTQAVGGVTATNTSIGSVNPVLAGCQAVGNGLDSTSTTNRDLAPCQADLGGTQYVRVGSSHPFSCILTLSSATTTQCRGAATSSIYYYVTDVSWAGTSTQTAGTIQVEGGTGSVCATTQVPITPKYNVAAGAVNGADHFTMPVFTTTSGSYLCVVTTGSTVSLTAVVDGFSGY